jgi:hypothetical protein
MLRANISVKYLVVLTVFLAFVIHGSHQANAQKGQKLSATPPAFQIFYAKFRKAVIARDKTTVASLTRFPLTYGFDAGDEGTFSRAEFLKRFNDIFGGERKVFALRNPTLYSESPGSFDLVDQNDASHYVFEKRGRSYQFTGYLSEP